MSSIDTALAPRSLLRRSRRHWRLPLGSVAFATCLATVAWVVPGPLGSSTAGASSKAKLTKVTAILGWYAEPARAGFYAAQDLGYYKDAGLDVKLLAGADVSPEQIVGSGRAQFGLDTADAIIQSVSQSIPIEGLATCYQQNAFILLYHKSANINSFSQLSNRTDYVFPGSLYWQYIMKRYNLTGVKQASYNGSLQPFLSTPNAVNQGYIGVENYNAKKAGVSVGYLQVSKSGYDPYSNVIFAQKTYVQTHKQIVKKFIAATMKGWASYKSKYKTVDKYMHQFNKGFTVTAMNYNAVAQEPLIYSGDALKHGLGYMSSQRWKATESALLYIGTIKSRIPLSQIFTDAFLPRSGA